MQNIHINKTELLNRLYLCFPNIRDNLVGNYNYGISDYAIIRSDLFQDITKYLKKMCIIFYFYNATYNAFESIKKMQINNIRDVEKVKYFYFHENMKSNKFSYFYITYEINYEFLILSDDSLDYSLLLYDKLLISSEFIKLLDDYFILKVDNTELGCSDDIKNIQ